MKINLVFKDFNSLVGTVPRALASGSGPDVTEGNQGYQTDAQLVKAKLILPLTKYVKKYGWDKLYAPSTWGMFRWTPDGKSFGKGPVWGIAQTGQNVVAFYNKKKLRAARLQPEQDAADVRGVRQAARPAAGEAARRRAGDPRGQQGGVRLHPPLRRHLGRVRQARRRSATGSTTCPARATTRRGRSRRSAKLQQWGKAGYFNDDYNALGYDASASGVRQGQGRLLDRRGLGLDDHQDRPRRGERRRDAGPARAGRHLDVDRRPLRPVAHLGEDEVRRTSAPSGSTT